MSQLVSSIKKAIPEFLHAFFIKIARGDGKKNCLTLQCEAIKSSPQF